VKLGQTLWIRKQDVVRGKSVGRSLVFFGVAKKACRRNCVESIALDKIVASGVEECSEGELEQQAMRDDRNQGAGFGGKVGGDRSNKDLVKATPGSKLGWILHGREGAVSTSGYASGL